MIITWGLLRWNALDALCATAQSVSGAQRSGQRHFDFFGPAEKTSVREAKDILFYVFRPLSKGQVVGSQRVLPRICAPSAADWPDSGQRAIAIVFCSLFQLLLFTFGPGSDRNRGHKAPTARLFCSPGTVCHQPKRARRSVNAFVSYARPTLCPPPHFRQNS